MNQPKWYGARNKCPSCGAEMGARHAGGCTFMANNSDGYGYIHLAHPEWAMGMDDLPEPDIIVDLGGEG
jgi:hypothetical protein